MTFPSPIQILDKKNVMRELINFHFLRWAKQFTVATKFVPVWSDSKYKFKMAFYKASWKLFINFLLDSWFF